MTFAELRTMIGIHPAARRQSRLAQPLPGCAQDSQQTVTLADAPPGSQVQVVQFLSGLSGDRQAHLRAYGLAPGRWLHVKQHAPVTVIQIDQTELALEDTLARLVSVSLKHPV
jgi:Fe2+ transport system protein FeoA